VAFYDPKRAALEFIEAHRTLENLTWYPSHGILITPGSLPVLKEITSSYDFTLSLLVDKAVPNRALRRIAQISLDRVSMSALENIDGSQLHELYLWRFNEIESVHRIAELFPTITLLEIPQLGATLQDRDRTLVCHNHVRSYSKAS
jgi:hypothetical protein